MRKRHYLKTAFVGGQLITGRHKEAIQDSLVMIERGEFLYAGERNAEMEALAEKEGFDMSLVMVTDSLEEATYLLYAGSPKTLIGEAFKKDASGTHVYLPGVMSRKKQIIPPLSEAVKCISK